MMYNVLLNRNLAKSAQAKSRVMLIDMNLLPLSVCVGIRLTRQYSHVAFNSNTNTQRYPVGCWGHNVCVRRPVAYYENDINA